MKAIKVLPLIALCCSSLMSCGGGEGDLSIEIVGTTQYMIDSKAQSCANKVAVALAPSTATPTQDITAQYVSYQGMTLTWKNTSDPVTINFITIEFDSPDLSKKCTISDDELMALFFDFDTNTAWDGTIPKATSTSPTKMTSASQCRIYCGGITVPSQGRAFSATGKVTVRGTQRDSSGNEKPVKATGTVKLMYQP